MLSLFKFVCFISSMFKTNGLQTTLQYAHDIEDSLIKYRKDPLNAGKLMQFKFL